MNPEALTQRVHEDYARFLNPWLGKLMAFAGFGVEASASGCIITDHEGREYIDCLGGYGVFSLGHRHPKVVEAVKRQLDLMPLSGKAFFSEPQSVLARKLAEIAPGDLQYTFFSNSGTEATEAALKFSKAATGRAKVVSTLGGYHGKTIGSLSATGREKYRTSFEPLMPGVEFIAYGDAQAAAEAIDESTACMIVEPIQGEGGIVVPPAGYLRDLQSICREKGALLVFDEVQSGLGRTGKMFGCEHDGVAPDLMTLAKSLGGGVMPIGATMGTEEVWEKVFSKNPLLHTSTFGGNPVACAAGIAALEVVQEEGLCEAAQVQGAKMKAGLESVRRSHPDWITEVRGIGLMLGVEFAMDEVGELTVAQMMKRGVCAAYTLNNPRVIRFEPPLIIQDSMIERAVEAFGGAVDETVEMLSALVS